MPLPRLALLPLPLRRQRPCRLLRPRAVGVVGRAGAAYRVGVPQRRDVLVSGARGFLKRRLKRNMPRNMKPNLLKRMLKNRKRYGFILCVLQEFLLTFIVPQNGTGGGNETNPPPEDVTAVKADE